MSDEPIVTSIEVYGLTEMFPNFITVKVDGVIYACDDSPLGMHIYNSLEGKLLNPKDPKHKLITNILRLLK